MVDQSQFAEDDASRISGPRTPEQCRAAAELALAKGEPLAAYDRTSDGLRLWPGDVRLRQLRGLSLSRSGAIEAAAEEFRALAEGGAADEETLGNLAQTYKALWLRDPLGGSATEYRRQASQAYRDAFDRTGGYWTGVNAAAMALAEGDRSAALDLAGKTLAICQDKLLREPEPTTLEAYWLRATCGEAALIAGRVDEAADWYRQAGALPGKRFAHVASTRRQARLVCGLVGADWGRLADCFVLPRIVAFTGHMLDAPDRATPRFPAALADAVKREIAARLDGWGPTTGFSSAACGGDLLFLETLLERGDEAVVVLPFPREQFVATSVDFAGPEMRARFDAVMERLGELIVASAWGAVAGPAEYAYANRLFCGLAKIQADLFDERPVLLAVQDEQACGEPGGAAEAVETWRAHGGEVELIELRRLARRALGAPGDAGDEATPQLTAPLPAAISTAPRQDVVALLFADVQGFSKLADAEVLLFVREFLARVAALPRAIGIAPLTANTWGDGIFAVFASVREAGEYALALAELVHGTRWDQFGLPAELGIRIALHAGPAFAVDDPLTGRPGYWGAHVSRAARMEPITPPGQVYASQAFAALARDDADGAFACRYVGRTPLAKGFGTFPTYHVARRAPRGPAAGAS
ncbi:MAG: adenylate/guanylate cyclase domain-containing protein [Pirellulales bacterium]|nr:adenylate/guanylate cyclase domain-containing protein [Pirellulales bacterium]